MCDDQETAEEIRTTGSLSSESRFQPFRVRGPSASATIIAHRRGVEPVDTWTLSAKFVLGMVPPESVPKIAQDALEAGQEGPAILRLAILEKPSGWEVDQLLPAFFKEMGIEPIDVSVAALRLAQRLARELLSSGEDPMQHKRKFYELWLKSGYSKDLTTIGNIDDCLAWMTPEQVADLARSELLTLVSWEVE